MPEHLLIVNRNGKGGVGKAAAPMLGMRGRGQYGVLGRFSPGPGPHVPHPALPSSTHPIRSQIKALVSQAIVE